MFHSKFKYSQKLKTRIKTFNRQPHNAESNSQKQTVFAVVNYKIPALINLLQQSVYFNRETRSRKSKPQQKNGVT